MTRVAVLFLCSALFLPRFASAQPQRGTVFISGGAFASMDWAPTNSGLGFGGSNDGTTAPGGMLGAGVFATERTSVRLEWAMTDWARTTAGFAVNPLATETVGPGSLVLGGPGVGNTSIYVPNYEQRRRTSAAFALLGYHVGDGRVALEALGGVGLVNEDQRTRYDARILGGLAYPLPENTFSSYASVAVIGADVRVALTDHAAVVPMVRAYATGGWLSLRPGVSLRWTF